MTRSPTAAVREQAAQLCSAMASMWALDHFECPLWSTTYTSLGREYAGKVTRLAWSSMEQALGVDPGHHWALACSMLRNFEVP